MKKYILVFFFFSTILFSIGHAQTATFTWSDPTCISPSNGKVQIVLNGYTGFFEYVIINTVTNIPTVVGPTTNTSHTFNNLSQLVTYVAYVRNTETDQIIKLESKELIAKPFFATTSQIKGAGCRGESVGIISATVTGGVAPYTYNWNNGIGAADDIVYNVGPNIYNAAITDAVGCTITSSNVQVVPVDVIVSRNILSDVICKGESTGRVSAIAAQGTGTFVYKWSDGSFGQLNSSLPAGNHSVVAIDEIACTDTAYFTITEPATKITISLTSKEDLKCKEVPTGKASFSTANGTTPLVYNWSDGGTGASRTNLSALEYKVVVTDNKLCKDSTTVTLTEPASKIEGSVDSYSMPLCFGNANGTANISASGGTPGYTYKWEDPENNVVENLTSRTDLISTTYTITFTDANNCTDIVPFTLPQPDKLTPVISQLDDTPALSELKCYGDSQDIKVLVQGGTVPMQSYIWNAESGIANDITTETIGLGFFKVTVTDNNNCVAADSITVTQPDSLINTISIVTPILCHGNLGELLGTAVGGVSPYSYAWSHGETLAQAEDVPSGIYSLIITDINGCEAYDTLEITQPEFPFVGSIDSYTMPICFGDDNGVASISASGGTPGYSYKWEDPENTIVENITTRTDLKGVEYIITFTDANNCTDIIPFTLPQPDKLVPSILAIDDSPALTTLNCFGDKTDIKITSIGGTLPIVSYVWNAESGILADETSATVGTGFYKVTLTDNNNCIATDSITITQPDSLVNTIQIFQPILCYGYTGELEGIATGGVSPYSYEWIHGETNNKSGNIYTGEYSLIITDANNCKAYDTLFLNQPDTILHVINMDADICYDITKGVLSVHAIGGTVADTYSFLWSTGETTDTIQNLIPQLYTVNVTDDNGCTVSSALDLSLINEFEISFTMQPVLCLGQSNGSVQASPINGTAPFHFAWSNGVIGTSITDVPAGWYTLTITDANGCKAIDSIQVTTIPPITISNSGTTTTYCNGNTASAYVKISNGTTPYSYLWNTGAIVDSLTNLSVGIYSVTITDANGCNTFKSFQVKDTSSLTVKASSTQLKIRCAGRADGAASAVATKGSEPYTYLWSNNTVGQNAANLVAGTYYVEASDKFGCKAIDSIKFVEENVFRILAKDSAMVSCNGGNNGWAFVNAQGGVAPYSISWSNSVLSNLNPNLSAGTYTAILLDANNCILNKSFTITEPLQLQASLSSISDVNCGGACDGSATVTASGGTAPYTYLWSSQETSSTAIKLCGGNQFVIITDKNNCSTQIDFEIKDTIAVLEMTAVLTSSDCGFSNGEIDVNASGGIAPYTYAWNTGDNTPLLQNIAAGAYSLTISDDNGCSIDSILVLDDISTITATFERQPITFCGPCNESYLVQADNATAPYSYVWSNGDASAVADSLCFQPYSVTITDGAGCKKSVVVSVIEKPLQVNLVSSKHVDCYGASTGELEVKAINGVSNSYSYSWSNGQTGDKATNLAAGVYTVTATDDLSVCPVSKSFTITENAKTQRFFTTNVPSYCKDSTGVVIIETIGGTPPFLYTWETGETGATLHNAWNDYISVTITDALGCVVIDSAKVDDISNFSAFEFDRYLISCIGDADGELEVGLDNGYSPFSYSWSHNATLDNARATGLAANTYTVYITDDKKCKIQHTFNALTNPAPMQISYSEPEPIFCFQGFGTVQATTIGGHPGYTYEWTFNGINQPETGNKVEGKPTGAFTTIAIDSRNCKSATASYTLNEPAKIQAHFTVELTGCGSLENTGSIKLDTIIGHNPPYKFRWHNESETSQFTYFYSNTNRERKNLAGGHYIFTVSDSVGLCSETFENYTYPIIVKSIDTVITHTHCNYYTNAQYDAKIPGGSIEIKKFTTQRADYNNETLYETITNFSNYSFAWEDRYNQTNAKASNLSIGDYFVNIKGPNECVSRMPAGTVEAFVNIEARIKDTKNNDFDRTNICLEDSLEVEATISKLIKYNYTPNNSDDLYTWNSIKNNSHAIISPQNTKTVWVNPLTSYYADSTKLSLQYVFDGCNTNPAYYTIHHYDSIEFKLEVLDVFDNYLGIDSVFAIQNEQFLINPTEIPWYVNKPSFTDGIVSIDWQSFDVSKKREGQIPDTTTNEATFIESGKYGLAIVAKEPNYYVGVATTTHGCKQTAKVFVNVYSNLFVPSGITPNGDGVNDTWIIPYLYMCPDARVTIYNRWGVKLYENDSEYYANPWNGTNKNGKLLPLGTYYYIIEYNDSKTAPQAGAISIIY